jgi:uncharacterized heparinase superfamily protein
VNWIKWELGGNSLSAECTASLAVQVRWLSRRLEFHILGNHLLANAKALVFGGVFFSGTEADRWFARGMEILTHELSEQIIPDGGHIERSTMYHAIVLEDMLDLVNLSRCFAPRFSRWSGSVCAWEEIASRMSKWLRTMLHPDGEISFFNDAAMGIASPPGEIFAYGERLAISISGAEQGGLTILDESGYIRIGLDDAVFLVDVAPVGPDYLPGHAHADTLCFEASVFGKRVFVNSGTGCYGTSSERLRQRGTSAHNTVVIEDQDSSEVWGGFRVARRAYPKVHRINDDGSRIEIDASHDGYRRLKGNNTHHRKWEISVGCLVVRDRIYGNFETAEARFHIHPDVEVDVKSVDEDRVELELPQQGRVSVSVDGAELRVEPSSWHPEFGISLASQCLVISFVRAEVTTSIHWYQAV